MAFLKALTVFIVCISIFGVIISNSTTVGNKNNSKNYNVLLTGEIICPFCKRSLVKINLDERGLVQHVWFKCDSHFEISKHLNTTPYIEDYELGFYLWCEGILTGEILKKYVKPTEDESGTYVFNFGKIDFTKTKKRRNRLENTIF
uniref:LITAF domain-containing protein n=1 Tax=Strongyloides papillosus TaxID=174720 RepID=A0A0N5CIX4_STREA